MRIWLEMTIVSYASLKTYLVTETGEEIGEEESTLRLEILDFQASGIKLTRLRIVIESLENIYNSLISISGLKGDSPRIVFIQSGSNIVLEIKGAAKIIDALSDLFFRVVDSIRFRKYDRIDREIETSNKLLELFEKFAKKSPDEAKILQDKIVKDIIMLSNNGVSMWVDDDIDRSTVTNFLTEHSTKLIAGNTAETKEPIVKDDDTDGE